MNTDTIAAIATGMNPSGIGIIRISGEDAFKVASSVFHRRNNVTINDFESHKAYFGYIYDKDVLIDEVILLAFKGPNSFTGEDTAEIQCHGGILIMNKILELCLSNGARCAQPGEFSKRAFLNGKMDLSGAEAVMDLISSKNDYALKNSIKQLTGTLYDKIKSIRDRILYEIAYIESALDDPEHISLDGYQDKLSIIISDILTELIRLSDSFDDGRILSEGVNTVILGKPNVGKSSLMNILAGSERAIVTNIAGTTRDTIEEVININGITLNIVDTAGIHEAGDIVEQIGVDKALKYAIDADLIILVIDSSSILSKEDEEIFDFVRKNNKKCVVLLNKSDLDTVIGEAEIKCFIDATVINVSAIDESGIDNLKKYITDQFSKGMLKFNDEIFISNIRHKEAINTSINSLKCVSRSIEDGMPEDFYSIDLTSAYESLGFIIGEQVDEDVINEIFAKFCMGK